MMFFLHIKVLKGLRPYFPMNILPLKEQLSSFQTLLPLLHQLSHQNSPNFPFFAGFMALSQKSAVENTAVPGKSS